MGLHWCPLDKMAEAIRTSDNDQNQAMQLVFSWKDSGELDASMQAAEKALMEEIPKVEDPAAGGGGDAAAELLPDRGTSDQPPSEKLQHMHTVLPRRYRPDDGDFRAVLASFAALCWHMNIAKDVRVAASYLELHPACGFRQGDGKPGPSSGAGLDVMIDDI